VSAQPFLLDTSVLLHLVRGKQLGLYIDKTFDLSHAVHRPLVSIVSHGELWVLAERNGWGADKRNAVALMLDNMVTIDINDRTVIDSYVEMARASQRLPGGARVLSNNDLWIAACTRAAGAILLTTDKDFLHLHPNHCVVTYIPPGSQLPGVVSATQPKIH
jgi:predicted nucleic acid-binding protein